MAHLHARLALPLLLVVSTPHAALAGPKRKPLKAKLVCSQTMAAGGTFALDPKFPSRITGTSLTCELTSKDHRVVEGGSPSVKTLWHKTIGGVMKTFTGDERKGSPIGGEGDGAYGFAWVLEKGKDWDECASDIAVPVTVRDLEGNAIFEQQLVLKQDCAPIPVAPSVSDPKRPPVEVGAKLPDKELEKLSPEARSLAKRLADAIVDEDLPGLLDMIPAGGLRLGKSKLTRDQVRARLSSKGIAGTFGIRPSVECEDYEKGTGCKWGAWTSVEQKGELLLYSNNDSGYGTFSALAFKRTGGAWSWVGTASYDTGEP